MKHLPFSVAVVLLVAAGYACGATEKWDGTAGIAFDGTSTLHNWGGKVSAEPFAATIETGADHPLIEGKFQDVSFVSIMPDGKTPSKLPFSLTLVGKRHDVAATVSNWKLSGDTATFDLNFNLSLKDCGITVPAAMLVVKVGDTVKVSAAVKLVRAKGN